MQLPHFHRQYRATALNATKVSHLEALTGRKMDIGIPSISHLKISIIHSHITVNDAPS